MSQLRGSLIALLCDPVQSVRLEILLWLGQVVKNSLNIFQRVLHLSEFIHDLSSSFGCLFWVLIEHKFGGRRREVLWLLVHVLNGLEVPSGLFWGLVGANLFYYHRSKRGIVFWNQVSLTQLNLQSILPAFWFNKRLRVDTFVLFSIFKFLSHCRVLCGALLPQRQAILIISLLLYLVFELIYFII